MLTDSTTSKLSASGTKLRPELYSTLLFFLGDD